MERDEEYNPQELLRALKKRTRERIAYQWRVQIHRPIEEILEIIQNRANPDYQAPPPEPYTVTANFNLLSEAADYACMVRLKGYQCSIMNNWTGNEFNEE